MLDVDVGYRYFIDQVSGENKDLRGNSDNLALYYFPSGMKWKR